MVQLIRKDSGTEIFINPELCTAFSRAREKYPEEGFLLYMADGKTWIVTRKSFLEYQNAFLGKTVSGNPLYDL